MRFRFRHGAVLVALVVLLAPSVLVAQQWAGRGRIRGEIKSVDGQPIEGAKITLLMGGQKGIGPEPILTDKRGKWSFLGLTGGDWTIIVEAEGFVPREGSVRVSEFGSGPNAKIELQTIPKEAAGGGAKGAVNEGNEHLAAGRYPEARAAYAKAIEELKAAEAESEDESLKTSRAWIHHAIGESYRLEGKNEEARKSYETALSLLPASEHAGVYTAIAATYKAEGNIDKALATLQKVLEANPENVPVLQAIIDVLLSEGRTEEAQTYMARLPEGQKLAPDTLLNMGIEMYNANDLDGALENFDRAVAENPDLADAYYFRGLVNLAKTNSEAATADFLKFVELSPEGSRAEEARQFLEFLQSK